jgi:hypothetical protein
MSDMHELPDGTGFFTMWVGDREPGFVNWLKYHKKGYARRWLFVWRMYWSSLYLSRQIGEPMTWWQALYYAVFVAG